MLLLCFYSYVSSMMPIHSFVRIAPFIWLYWNAEPSAFFKRALACASPSPRLNDNEPSATCWILKNDSVNPHICFWKSPKELHSISTERGEIGEGTHPYGLLLPTGRSEGDFQRPVVLISSFSSPCSFVIICWLFWIIEIKSLLLRCKFRNMSNP